VVAKVNAASVPRSERILGRSVCLSSDLVGHCVRIRAPKTGNRFEVEKLNITVSGSPPAVAVVIKKYSPTDCIIQFSGPMIGVYGGLSFGAACLVGTDGLLAQVGDANYPVGGVNYFQQMGVATSTNEVLLNPLPAIFGGLHPDVRFFQQVLSATVDPRIFNTSFNFRHGGVDTEVVYYNGQRLLEGVGNDYVAVESGGIGTGYDTIVLEFTPYPPSNWSIDYTPDV